MIVENLYNLIWQVVITISLMKNKKNVLLIK
jgi:hypothetical protein